MLFRSIFARPRDDLKFWIERPRIQHDVNVGCVRCGGGHKTRGVFHTGFPQAFLVRSIAYQSEPVGGVLKALLIILNDHKWDRLLCELVGNAAADAAGAADRSEEHTS